MRFKDRSLGHWAFWHLWGTRGQHDRAQWGSGETGDWLETALLTARGRCPGAGLLSLYSHFLAVCAVNGFPGQSSRCEPGQMGLHLSCWKGSYLFGGLPALKRTVKVHLIYAPVTK